jgi:SAM-dependent methyltransferase
MTINITESVRGFYDKLPFNLRSEVADHVEGIKKIDYVFEMYPILRDIDLSKKTIIDVGCGVGWFANFLATQYRPKAVWGLDFSKTAINRAREVSTSLGTDVNFLVADLFEYQPPQKFDIVISNGALHHTGDCVGAIRRLCAEYLANRGHIFVGLYHEFGRKPFLDHFASLRGSGLSEEELFAEYRRLHSKIEDQTHAMSWFRDQVLHPHETQHTANEVAGLFSTSGVRFLNTSINGFGPVTPLEVLAEPERHLEAVGRQRLQEGEYFPGFFTCTGRKMGRFEKLFSTKPY